MKMLFGMALLSFVVCADVARADDTPHLFNDLNGNGRIDDEEVAASSSSSSGNGQIEEIILPDTPLEAGESTEPT